MRPLVVVLVALVMAAASASPSFATHGGDGQTHDGTVQPAGNGLTVQVALSQGGSEEDSPQPISSVVHGITHTESVCSPGRGGSTTCSELELCDDGSVMTATWTTYPTGPPSAAVYQCSVQTQSVAPQVTPGLVLSALRRIPLPASELVVQPPGGRTLVNFETNFYTEQGEFTRVVRLLGRRVVLRIWPGSFTWVYGDGSSERTSSAGSPYPDLEITHRYLVRGRVAVRVDTTYAAEFRVGGGPWRSVDGTVTIPGDAEGLRVVTARPVLVGG